MERMLNGNGFAFVDNFFLNSIYMHELPFPHKVALVKTSLRRLKTSGMDLPINGHKK